MQTRLMIVAATLILVGCGAGRQDSRAVSRAEFGSEWPFTVAEGTVFCRVPSQALFESNGETYPLNGSASARSAQEGYRNLNDIWRPNPDIPGTRVPIGDMIQLALEQCE